MLSDKLAETLIKRGLLSVNTQVELYNDVGNYLIKSIDRTQQGFLFKIININNHKVKRVDSSKVFMLDGMLPQSLADAYDIMPDGAKKVLGKRRGRPRKNPRPDEE